MKFRRGAEEKLCSPALRCANATFANVVIVRSGSGVVGNFRVRQPWRGEWSLGPEVRKRGAGELEHHVRS